MLQQQQQTPVRHLRATVPRLAGAFLRPGFAGAVFLADALAPFFVGVLAVGSFLTAFLATAVANFLLIWAPPVDFRAVLCMHTTPQRETYVAYHHVSRATS